MPLFELLGILLTTIALLGYLNHRFIGLPDTIGVMAVGMVASLALVFTGGVVPELRAWALGLEQLVDLPTFVLNGLLGVLLFAAGLHFNFSDLSRQRVPVLVLATLGVLTSTLVVGMGTFWVLQLMGVHLPLVYCFLFGALISPTDPIAVLSVLKTVGAPKELETTIAGESLFNDGTAVVAFMVLLGLASGTAEPSVRAVATLLAQEVGGGALVGLAVGLGAVYLLKGVNAYALEILITLAVATGGYSLAQHLHVSAPLAAVIMGLVVGNHGASSSMSEQTREHLFSFWELLDEVLNLVLFGLIGLKLLSLETSHSHALWLAGVSLIPVVLFARFVSVGLPFLALRSAMPKSPHTVKLLTWGGLRGGISVALALSLPAFDGKDLLVVGTYVVVVFSLLVQAPSLGRLVTRLSRP